MVERPNHKNPDARPSRNLPFFGAARIALLNLRIARYEENYRKAARIASLGHIPHDVVQRSLIERNKIGDKIYKLRGHRNRLQR